MSAAIPFALPMADLEDRAQASVKGEGALGQRFLEQADGPRIEAVEVAYAI